MTEHISKRSLFQFRLRTLVILVALLSLLFGFVGKKLYEGRRQAAFVAEITRSGGGVTYKGKWGGRELTWLQEAFGNEYFGSIEVVRANVDGSQDIRSLVTRLANLADLNCLSLSGEITDADIAHLGRLGKVGGLYLRFTNIGDAGLIHLKEHLQIRLLSLDGTRLTDRGLVHLRGMKQLQILSIADTQITDRGLIHLGDMETLMFLFLDGTQISDAGLLNLCKLKYLERLSIKGTKVTNRGVEKLQKALPNCTISFESKD